MVKPAKPRVYPKDTVWDKVTPTLLEEAIAAWKSVGYNFVNKANIRSLADNRSTCGCCALNNFEQTTNQGAFRGVAVWLTPESLAKGNFAASVHEDMLETVTRETCSYIIPETGETIYYSIAIEGHVTGEKIVSCFVPEEEEDDDF